MTEAFSRGAEQACRIARLFGVNTALLKSRSPSCGSGAIYDGSFSGRIVPGNGVTAEALTCMGVRVYGEESLTELLSATEDNKDDIV